jgi:hypothetical protein
VNIKLNQNGAKKSALSGFFLKLKIFLYRNEKKITITCVCRAETTRRDTQRNHQLERNIKTREISERPQKLCFFLQSSINHNALRISSQGVAPEDVVPVSAEHRPRREIRNKIHQFEIQKIVKYPKDQRNSNLFLRVLKLKEYLLKEQRARMLYLYQQSRDNEERYTTKSINSIYKNYCSEISVRQ